MEPPRSRVQLTSMGRQLRPHVPGAVFHITARTQAKEPCFTGMEGAIDSMIRTAPSRSDARLIAYAVMPNHIHLIVQQGIRRLSDFMQPLLRRMALLVQQRYDREGHVFERRYSHSICADAEYIRNAIVYVHLNPVRAGMTASPDDYPWTSHHAFCGSPHPEEAASTPLSRENALRLFAGRGTPGAIRCQASYRRFLAWRVRMDAWLNGDLDAAAFHAPARPSTELGDQYWEHWYALRVTPEGVSVGRLARADLRDIAIATLSSIAPDLPLDVLRSGGTGKQLVRIRRHFILRALGAGYPGTRIAGFLNVSPSTVSSTRAAAPVKIKSL